MILGHLGFIICNNVLCILNLLKSKIDLGLNDRMKKHYILRELYSWSFHPRGWSRGVDLRSNYRWTRVKINYYVSLKVRQSNLQLVSFLRKFFYYASNKSLGFQNPIYYGRKMKLSWSEPAFRKLHNCLKYQLSEVECCIPGTNCIYNTSLWFSDHSLQGNDKRQHFVKHKKRCRC